MKKYSQDIKCPYCGSHHIYEELTQDGRDVFKCEDCDKEFENREAGYALIHKTYNPETSRKEELKMKPKIAEHYAGVSHDIANIYKETNTMQERAQEDNFQIGDKVGKAGYDGTIIGIEGMKVIVKWTNGTKTEENMSEINKLTGTKDMAKSAKQNISADDHGIFQIPDERDVLEEIRKQDRTVADKMKDSEKDQWLRIYEDAVFHSKVRDQRDLRQNVTYISKMGKDGSGRNKKLAEMLAMSWIPKGKQEDLFRKAYNMVNKMGRSNNYGTVINVYKKLCAQEKLPFTYNQFESNTNSVEKGLTMAKADTSFEMFKTALENTRGLKFAELDNYAQKYWEDYYHQIEQGKEGYNPHNMPREKEDMVDEKEYGNDLVKPISSHRASDSSRFAKTNDFYRRNALLSIAMKNANHFVKRAEQTNIQKHFDPTKAWTKKGANEQMILAAIINQMKGSKTAKAEELIRVGQVLPLVQKIAMSNYDDNGVRMFLGILEKKAKNAPLKRSELEDITKAIKAYDKSSKALDFVRIILNGAEMVKTDEDKVKEEKKGTAIEMSNSNDRLQKYPQREVGAIMKDNVDHLVVAWADGKVTKIAKRAVEMVGFTKCAVDDEAKKYWESYYHNLDKDGEAYNPQHKELPKGFGEDMTKTVKNPHNK